MNEALILLSSYPHLGLKSWGLLKESLPLPGSLP